MRIVYLLESTAPTWVGAEARVEVEVVRQDVALLLARGHEVLVLSQSATAGGMPLPATHSTVTEFNTVTIPAADLIIGTDWASAIAAAASGRGQAVHLLHDYDPAPGSTRPEIDEALARQDIPKLVNSERLVTGLRRRFDVHSRLVPEAIDHAIMFADPKPRIGARPARVGLVGSYQIDPVGIAAGYAAGRVAALSGYQFEAVRISSTMPAAAERALPFPVEWHVAVDANQMGDLYRSLDVYLGTSLGDTSTSARSALEAMACGTPCVLPDHPNSRDYGPEQYALFAATDDATEFAQAMILASNHESTRAALRENGRRTAARYTTAAHADALEEALTAILTANRLPA